jgi:hypothetical protein
MTFSVDQVHPAQQKREDPSFVSCDIIEMILKDISNHHRLQVCARVNQTWRLASYRLVKVHFDHENMVFVSDPRSCCVRVVSAACDSLTELDMHACPFTDDRFISELLSACQRGLTRLSLARCDLLSEACVRKVVVEACCSLTSLDLSEITEFGDEGIAHLAHACSSSLSSLHVKGCRRLTNHGMASLAPLASTLTSLDVSHCWRINTIKWVQPLTLLEHLGAAECTDIPANEFRHLG